MGEQKKKKIDDIDIKIKQLQEQKKQLAQKLKAEERKDRTRKLIQFGAMSEKYFSVKTLEEYEEFCKWAVNIFTVLDKYKVKDGEHLDGGLAHYIEILKADAARNGR